MCSNLYYNVFDLSVKVDCTIIVVLADLLANNAKFLKQALKSLNKLYSEKCKVYEEPVFNSN